MNVAQMMDKAIVVELLKNVNDVYITSWVVKFLSISICLLFQICVIIDLLLKLWFGSWYFNILGDKFLLHSGDQIMIFTYGHTSVSNLV